MILLNHFFCITGHDEAAGKQIFHIRLQADHFVFKAHFPDAPIVPGVCQVGMVGEVLSLYTGKKLCLAYVKNIKYLKTMQPTEATDYDITLHEVVPEGNGYKVIATFSTPEAAYAKLSLTFVSESV